MELQTLMHPLNTIEDDHDEALGASTFFLAFELHGSLLSRVNFLTDVVAKDRKVASLMLFSFAMRDWHALHVLER